MSGPVSAADGAAARAIDIYDTPRVRRRDDVKPFLGQLTERYGKRWGDARRWALAEVDAGRRAWKPADMPPQSPNQIVLAAYLTHLETTEGTTTS